MSLLRPKSKVVLTDSLKEKLDNYEIVDSSTAKETKGVKVFKAEKERKQNNFADLVGDEIFFEDVEKEEEHDDEKKADFSCLIDILIILGLLLLIFISYVLIKKFIV